MGGVEEGGGASGKIPPTFYVLPDCYLQQPSAIGSGVSRGSVQSPVYCSPRPPAKSISGHHTASCWAHTGYARFRFGLLCQGLSRLGCCVRGCHAWAAVSGGVTPGLLCLELSRLGCCARGCHARAAVSGGEIALGAIYGHHWLGMPYSAAPYIFRFNYWKHHPVRYH